MKQYAEILVKCGYAKFMLRPDIIEVSGYSVKVNPFADTLEGRRQADAIEGYLRWHETELWKESYIKTSKYYESMIDSLVCKVHQWRLDRIKWCVEQLEQRNA